MNPLDDLFAGDTPVQPEPIPMRRITIRELAAEGIERLEAWMQEQA